MTKINPKDIEDNYTVADMSEIERPSLFKKNKSKFDLDLDPEERKWVIIGAMKATFMICMAYVVVLGLIVLLMFMFFKMKG